LKVLHAVLSLECGGLERLVIHLCREGIAAGDEVTVLCLENPGALASKVHETGTEVVSLGRTPGLMTIPEALHLRREIKRLRPDVIHCHQMSAALYVGTVARSLGISALLHTEHGNHDYSNWRQWVTAWIAFNAVRRIYCVSQEIADNLTSHRLVPPHRLSIQVNGIPLPSDDAPSASVALRKACNIADGALVIGSVGRLVTVKRQERLLKAVATMVARNRSVHLLLVGDGARREELEAQARSLGIGQLVHFAGFKLEPQPYIGVMDIFVLTSDSEGMPMALLEAWAAAKPVVVTAVGGLPNLVDEGVNGFLLPAGDHERLVSRLEALADDPECRRRLGNNGRELVAAKYSAAQSAAAYRNAYLELIAGGAH